MAITATSYLSMKELTELMLDCEAPKYFDLSVMFARVRKPDTSVAMMLFMGGCCSDNFLRQ
eukprot:4120014-Amphidinium_carterae.1